MVFQNWVTKCFGQSQLQAITDTAPTNAPKETYQQKLTQDNKRKTIKTMQINRVRLHLAA